MDDSNNDNVNRVILEDAGLEFEHVSEVRNSQADFEATSKYSESVLSTAKPRIRTHEMTSTSSLVNAIKNVKRIPKSGNDEFDSLTDTYVNSVSKIIAAEKDVAERLENELILLKEQYEDLNTKYNDLIKQNDTMEAELKEANHSNKILENKLKEEKFEHHKTGLTLAKEIEFKNESEAKLKKCLEKMIQLKKLWQKEQRLRQIAEKNSQKVISSAKSTLKYVFDCKGPMDQVLNDDL